MSVRNVVHGVLTGPWVMTDLNIKICRDANLVVNNWQKFKSVITQGPVKIPLTTLHFRHAETNLRSFYSNNELKESPSSLEVSHLVAMIARDLHLAGPGFRLTVTTLEVLVWASRQLQQQTHLQALSRS